MQHWQPSIRLPERRPKAARKLQAGPPVVLSLGFVVLIAIGTLLLKLPFATVHEITWMQGFFTATSAVTVTGLAVVDTGTSFTLFGQWVIALLIQFGGLGFMTFGVVTLLALGAKLDFFQQTVAMEAFNQTDTSTLFHTAKAVIGFALLVEAIGMLILTLYWAPDLGWWQAAWHGFFYAISAFNNAGFALHSDSLMPYVSDGVVNLTISALFISGGLGFSVWLELRRKRRWRELTVYTRLMLVGTLVINLIALLAVYAIEFDNPATLGALQGGDKWLAAWFQAVTPRTAGFNTLAIDQLEDATSALTLLLMFIGGGSMSTASGIKVVTFMVLVLATYSYLRRDASVTAFGRSLCTDTVRKALAVTVISVGISWIAIFLLLATESAPFLTVVFEAISALGTVGLSRGLTADLSVTGTWIIILLMWVGRIGPLTTAYFLASPRKRRLAYPEAKITIG